jgi:hypothetical protein
MLTAIGKAEDLTASDIARRAIREFAEHAKDKKK